MAYAILRSIPNKLGGVIALAISIIILIMCPFIYKRKFRGYAFYPFNKWLFWVHVNVFILLSWLGARPVEEPYILIGQLLSAVYFRYYFIRFFLQFIWDSLLKP
jgi:ubiquinol-cytochrome c reductase cytochrome b subunit